MAKVDSVSLPVSALEVAAARAVEATSTSASAAAGAAEGDPCATVRRFRCQKVIDATHGERGVRCMVMVGNFVWGGSRDGLSIEVRNVKTGAFVKKIKHPDEHLPKKNHADKLRLDIVSMLVVGPRHIWTGGSDGLIRIWDWQNETCLQSFKAHAGSVDRMSLSPDGNVWSGTRNKYYNCFLTKMHIFSSFYGLFITFF